MAKFSQLKLVIIFAFLIIQVQAAFSQEPLGAGISINGEVPHGFYKARIRYGNEPSDSLYIKWSHAANADTFWVYKAKSSLEYITNAGIRAVWYNQPLRYERRMSGHHLKEYMLNSPLKFENLENLTKNKNQLFLGKNLLEYFTK